MFFYNFFVFCSSDVCVRLCLVSIYSTSQLRSTMLSFFFTICDVKPELSYMTRFAVFEDACWKPCT